MSNITESLFGAIDVIVDKKIREAAYDRTFIATIIRQEKGNKYRIRYQDAVLSAFAVGGQVYTKDTKVYVLAPTNSLDDVLYILGTDVAIEPSIDDGNGGSHIQYEIATEEDILNLFQR